MTSLQSVQLGVTVRLYINSLIRSTRRSVSVNDKTRVTTDNYPFKGNISPRAATYYPDEYFLELIFGSFLMLQLSGQFFHNFCRNATHVADDKRIEHFAIFALLSKSCLSVAIVVSNPPS